MKMKVFYKVCLIFTGILVLGACAENSRKKPEQEPIKIDIPPEQEDDLLLRLSSKLINNPTTQVDKERNTLIEYAIDNLLDIQEAPQGFFYQITQVGTGQNAKWGDYVTAHYKGYFLDGRVFDTSYKRNEPLSFYIGNMIAGWNDGLTLMNKNSKAIFLIPSHLAYNEKGLGKLVPPNTPLIFEVHLLEIEAK